MNGPTYNRFFAQPRVRLAELPTPLYHARRLSEYLGGPQIYLKRDDLTGLATGGNKTRKLEYLIADALAKQTTDIITEGGIQSNHCRQTAAAACRYGLQCHLVLNGEFPMSPPQGNLLLDSLLGASIRYVADSSDRRAVMESVADKLREQGRVPYIVPSGGSNAIGALGYVGMILELTQQLHQLNLAPVRLYSGACSGGTLAGLMLGNAMFVTPFHVTGVLASGSTVEDFEVALTIAKQAAERIGYDGTLSHDSATCDDSQVGEGYGIPTEASLQSIQLLAHYEGILLDPVYSSKGFAGMLADIPRQSLNADQSVVFVHTGGQASLSGKVGSLSNLLV